MHSRNDKTLCGAWVVMQPFRRFADLVSFVLLTGEFDPLPGTAQAIRSRKNRAGSLVIPGQGNVTTSIFDIVPLSVLPASPIPTYVSGMLITPQPIEDVAGSIGGPDNATTVPAQAAAPSSNLSVEEAALASYHLAANETAA
jgi:hypothetical protein